MSQIFLLHKERKLENYQKDFLFKTPFYLEKEKMNSLKD
jgi:hypothetical protein